MGTDKESLLGLTRKFTARSIKYILLVFFLLSIVNISLFVASVFVLRTIDEMHVYVLSLIAVFVLGLSFTLIALYVTYKFVLVDALNKVYKQVSPFFRKLCNLIISKVGVTPQHSSTNSKLIGKAFDMGDVLKASYGNNVPRFLQKAIGFIVKRIPFVPILDEVMASRQYSTQDEINERFYEQVDSYIRDFIFTSNSMKWLYWYLPLNIVFQAVLIYCLSLL